MKLKLTEEKGIHILEVKEDVDVQNFKVLKAGITKLLKDGRNRMILDFTEAPKIDSACLRELAEVNLVARELSGEIMLASLSPFIRANVENLGKPSALTCFPSREAAIAIFERMGKEPEEEEEEESTKGMTPDQALTKKKEEIKELREQLKKKEGGELAAAKQEAATLRAENKTLQARILTHIKERRVSDDLKTSQEMVSSLEKRYSEIALKIEEMEAKAKK